MSVWTRLFGQSEQQPAAVKPRLGLESLEAREVPAAPVTPMRWFQVGPAPVADVAGYRADNISLGLVNSSTAAVRHRYFAIVDRTTLAPTTDVNVSDVFCRADGFTGGVHLGGGNFTNNRDDQYDPGVSDRITSTAPGPAAPADTERDASPLPVLLVLADRSVY
jgi:hypothetical protein